MNLINFGDPRLFTYYALFISIRFGLTFNLMPTKKCEHRDNERCKHCVHYKSAWLWCLCYDHRWHKRMAPALYKKHATCREKI